MKKIIFILTFICSTTVLFDALACEPACISQVYYDSGTPQRIIGYGDENCTKTTGSIPQGDVCCEGPGC